MQEIYAALFMYNLSTRITGAVVQKKEPTIYAYQVCKRCGKKVSESRAEWKKKLQKNKRVCNACLRASELARQTAREKAEFAGYGWF